MWDGSKTLKDCIIKPDDKGGYAKLYIPRESNKEIYKMLLFKQYIKTIGGEDTHFSIYRIIHGPNGAKLYRATFQEVKDEIQKNVVDYNFGTAVIRWDNKFDFIGWDNDYRTINFSNIRYNQAGGRKTLSKRSKAKYQTRRQK
jgi:hypothetical protein